MRRIPQGIHLNDMDPLREMLGVDKPYKLPESTLGIYQRVARYTGALSTATLSNVPGALLTVAWHVEEIEAKRMGCAPEDFSAEYNAEQKAKLDATKKEAVKQPVGAK